MQKVKVKVIRPEAWIEEALPVARWLALGLPYDHIVLGIMHRVDGSDGGGRRRGSAGFETFGQLTGSCQEAALQLRAFKRN